MTRLMSFWTAAMGLFVLESVAISNFSGPSEGIAGAFASLLSTCALAGTIAWGLVPFFRLDERVRKLMVEPNHKHIADLVALGPRILSELPLILASNYQLTRLAAVECLARLGEDARPLLIDLSSDRDPEVADAARFAIQQLPTGNS